MPVILTPALRQRPQKLPECWWCQVSVEYSLQVPLVQWLIKRYCLNWQVRRWWSCNGSSMLIEKSTRAISILMNGNQELSTNHAIHSALGVSQIYWSRPNHGGSIERRWRFKYINHLYPKITSILLTTQPGSLYFATSQCSSSWSV